MKIDLAEGILLLDLKFEVEEHLVNFSSVFTSGYKTYILCQAYFSQSYCAIFKPLDTTTCRHEFYQIYLRDICSADEGSKVFIRKEVYTI